MLLIGKSDCVQKILEVSAVSLDGSLETLRAILQRCMDIHQVPRLVVVGASV